MREMNDGETEFLRARANELLMETVDDSIRWKKETDTFARAMFNVNIPSDGENYFVKVTLSKEVSDGNADYLLVSNETGTFADIYHLRGGQYQPLEELGKLVFEEPEQGRR